jgi:hypothetical protein
MKNIRYFFLCTVFLLGCFSGIALPPREILRDKLIIYYISNPGDQLPALEFLLNADIYAGRFNGGFWTNPNMAGAQRLVKGLIAPPASGGDVTLQNLAAKIIQIQNLSVVIYLLDDSGSVRISENISQAFDVCLENITSSATRKSWPCARFFDRDDPKYVRGTTGQIVLGTYFLSTFIEEGYNSTTINRYRGGVFLHELIHTQDGADGRNYMFTIPVQNRLRDVSYGTDESHLTIEVLPNLAYSYGEAIANVFRMAYDDKMYTDGLLWYRGEDRLIAVETPPSQAPASQLRGACPDIWLFDQLPRDRLIRTRGRYNYFRIEDIPLRYIMHNEWILALILETWRRDVGTDRFIRVIQQNNYELFQRCSYPIAITFLHMCREDDSATPLALAHFFTGYRARNVEDFRIMFENQTVLDDLLQSHWAGLDGLRSSVRIDMSYSNLIGTLRQNLPRY